MQLEHLKYYQINLQIENFFEVKINEIIQVLLKVTINNKLINLTFYVLNRIKFQKRKKSRRYKNDLMKYKKNLL